MPDAPMSEQLAHYQPTAESSVLSRGSVDVIFPVSRDFSDTEQFIHGVFHQNLSAQLARRPDLCGTSLELQDLIPPSVGAREPLSYHAYFDPDEAAAKTLPTLFGQHREVKAALQQQESLRNTQSSRDERLARTLRTKQLDHSLQSIDSQIAAELERTTIIMPAELDTPLYRRTVKEQRLEEGNNKGHDDKPASNHQLASVAVGGLYALTPMVSTVQPMINEVVSDQQHIEQPTPVVTVPLQQEGTPGTPHKIFIVIGLKGANLRELPPPPTAPPATTKTATAPPTTPPPTEPSPSATPTVPNTETPQPKEWVGVADNSGGYLSPDSKAWFNRLPLGNYEYLGSLYDSENKPNWDVVQLADGSRVYVDPKDVTTAFERHPFEGEVDWRKNEVAGVDYKVELEGRAEKTEIIVLGSSTWGAETMKVKVGFGLEIGANQSPTETPTPTPLLIPDAGIITSAKDSNSFDSPTDSREIRQFTIQYRDAESTNPWGNYITLTEINGAVQLEIAGQEVVQLGAAGGLWQIELQNHGTTIAVSRIEESGELHQVTTADIGINVGIIRAKIEQENAGNRLRQLSITASPDLLLNRDESRALNGGLAEMAQGKLSVGLGVTMIPTLLEHAPNGLAVMQRETSLVNALDYYHFQPGNLVANREMRRQFEQLMSRHGLGFRPHLFADSEQLRIMGTVGYDQYVADILNDHFGKAAEIVIWGNVKSNGQLEDANLVRDLAEKIAASGNVPIIATNDHNGDESVLRFDNQTTAALANIHSAIPQIKGILYSPYLGGIGEQQFRNFDAKSRSTLDILKAAYERVEWADMLTSDANGVNAADLYQAVIRIAAAKKIGVSFPFDGYNQFGSDPFLDPHPLITHVGQYRYVPNHPYYDAVIQALNDL